MCVLPKSCFCVLHIIDKKKLILNWICFSQEQSEKVWAIRLLSVACLSVAAKIEECHVPMLPEFPVSGYGLFESKAIQRMELLVLTELEWKMGSLTPFSYLNYFIHKFAANEEISKELIISNSVELILAMTRGNEHKRFTSRNNFHFCC